MKLLAVSDTPVQSLENMVLGSKSKLKTVEMIVSCGDLDKHYIEFLVDGLNQELFFVNGNHLCCHEKEGFSDEYYYDDILEKIKLFKEKKAFRIAGKKDLHGRIVLHKNYYIIGFGGSKWYGGRSNEFSEKQMAAIVRRVIRKLKIYMLRDKLLKKQKKDVIVISHAPVRGIHDLPDACHSGFECFKEAIKNISPVVWLHGHIHLSDNSKNQVTVSGATTVVNVSGYKFINLSKDHIDISYKSSILSS